MLRLSIVASVVGDKMGLKKKLRIASVAATERMDAASHVRKLVPLIYIKRINIRSGDAVTSRAAVTAGESSDPSKYRKRV